MESGNAIITGIPMVTGEVFRMTNQGRLLPYIKDSVYCNFGKNLFASFAENWMDKDYVSSNEITHVEENAQVYTVKVGADVAAAGPGGAVTVSYGQNFAGYAQVQPGYSVALPPIGKMARVASVNVAAKTFIIEPNDKEYKIDLKAGNELIIIPAALIAACSCDTVLSSSKLPGLLYKTKMGIIKKSYKACGEDMAQWLESRTLFPIKSASDPTKEIDVWWHRDLDQMWFEFTLAKQMFFMFAEDVTNNSANFNNIKSTTGVMHILRSRATQEPVAAATGISFDYFKTLARKIKRIRNYCNQYSLWSGANHRSQMDTALEGKTTKMETEASWDFLNGDKERGIRFGFDAVKVDGIEFYLHDEGSFNDISFLGAAGFSGPDTTFGVPMCKVNTGAKNSTPIVINYLSGNGINRELVENDYGILRPGSNKSDCDFHQWDLMSEFGVDMYCAQNFIFTESI